MNSRCKFAAVGEINLLISMSSKTSFMRDCLSAWPVIGLVWEKVWYVEDALKLLWTATIARFGLTTRSKEIKNNNVG
jgi:hypothetical protein